MNAVQRLLECRTPAECAQKLVFFAIGLLINILIIRFLWNTALVKHITVFKPATTLLDTLLLALALSLVR
jgi:hypothetical protein